METNFRDANLADIVAEFKRHGYSANMYYLTLDSIEQSVFRVNQRVRNGGHFVDHKNIEQNFEIGLKYLDKLADRFDLLEIVDAAGEGFRLRSLLRVKEQRLQYVVDDISKRLQPTIKSIAAKFTLPGQRLRSYQGPKH